MTLKCLVRLTILVANKAHNSFSLVIYSGTTLAQGVGCVSTDLPPTDEPETSYPNIETEKDHFCVQNWFTNATHIPGERTISGS